MSEPNSARTQGAGASPPLIRRLNAEAMIRYAMSEQVFSASDAMASTGLTRATVIDICDSLIDSGWLRLLDDSRAARAAGLAGPTGDYSKGRPAKRYELEAAAGVVVGIDAGQHTVTVNVADLRGQPLGHRRDGFEGDGLDADARQAVTRAAVDAALADAGTSVSRILITVIGVPAPVDEAGASPDGRGVFWSRMNPGFSDSFAGYGHVVVENDANLAAIAEQAIGAGAGIPSFAAVLSGERFGAGLIVDGALLHGRHGGAGELRVLDVVEGVGSSDGLAALVRDWARAALADGTVAPTSALAALGADHVTAEAVFEAAAVGDPAATELVARLGERFARVCFVLGAILDVERVVLVGAMAASAGPVISAAETVLAADYYSPVPELVASTLGADSVVLGAVQDGLARIRRAPMTFTPAR